MLGHYVTISAWSAEGRRPQTRRRPCN